MGDADQAVPDDGQTTIDAADTAAGYRQVLDPDDTTDLPPGDPNIACAAGDLDHLNHVGDEVTDDGGVGAYLDQPGDA